jgi:hypothetical protein
VDVVVDFDALEQYFREMHLFSTIADSWRR